MDRSAHRISACLSTCSRLKSPAAPAVETNARSAAPRGGRRSTEARPCAVRPAGARTRRTHAVLMGYSQGTHGVLTQQPAPHRASQGLRMRRGRRPAEAGASLAKRRCNAARPRCNAAQRPGRRQRSRRVHTLWANQRGNEQRRAVRSASRARSVCCASSAHQVQRPSWRAAGISATERLVAGGEADSDSTRHVPVPASGRARHGACSTRARLRIRASSTTRVPRHLVALCQRARM